ncbi:MAG: portal protein [Pseudomonadota bacterium]
MTTLLETALERMDTAWEAEQDVRRTMGEDYTFITKDDGMWEGSFQSDYMKAKHTFDLISPVVNQMVSEQRATRIGINCLPISSEASTKLADKRGGILRAIQEDCDAVDHYARAFEEAAICGFGALRVKTAYVSDEAWDQELRIEHITSAFSCAFIDPASQMPDGSDAFWGFVIHDYTDEQIKREFNLDVSEVNSFQDTVYEWHDADTNRTRIAEYYYKEPVKKEVALMSDGSTYDLNEVDINELIESGLEVLKQRTCNGYKVMKAILSGNKVLQEAEETPFNAIPIIPVYGVSRFTNGKRYSFGIVRKAKDPSRLINWIKSRTIEEAAYSPAKKVAMTKKSIQENIEDVANLTDPTKPVLGYTPDPSAPNAGLPTVIGGYELNVGMEALSSNTQMALKEIIGVFGGNVDPSMTQLSGAAIGALQGRSDNGTFIYQDNLMIAIERVGEICNSALSKVYPEQRMVFMLGEDGERYQEEINAPRENGVMNDLSVGKYKVKIESGASFATQRREVSEKLQALVTADPSMMSIAGDLLVKNLDLGDGGALAARMRKQAIMSGVIDESEMTDDEREEMAAAMQQQQAAAMQNSQIAELDMQLTIEAKKLELARLQAEVSETQSKVKLNEAKAINEVADAEKKQIEAAIALNKPQDTKVIL